MGDKKNVIPRAETLFEITIYCAADFLRLVKVPLPLNKYENL